MSGSASRSLGPAVERERLLDAYRRACTALDAAQQDNGAWAGEVVWNPMLVCQYVICCHIVGREIPPERRARIRRSLELQRKRDGGWGMHPFASLTTNLDGGHSAGLPRSGRSPERGPQTNLDGGHSAGLPRSGRSPSRGPQTNLEGGHSAGLPRSGRSPSRGPLPSGRPSGSGLAGEHDSWMFHTVLGYVALRLLGEDPSDPLLRDARAWIHAHGGPYHAPTWGRVWLALLGLYPWAEVQPLLPELWLLPDDSPMHPRRLYCHMRLIYLGLSYVYGARTQADAAPLLELLRRELYGSSWDPARFRATRDDIAPSDLYEPIGRGLGWIFLGARALGKVIPNAVRRRALERAWTHIEFEFTSTNYVCLSPVNGMLFCLAMHTRDRHDPRLERALAGLEYWMWEDEREGLRICGARSDIWDTSFALQALCEGPELDDAARLVARASAWLPSAQLSTDIPNGRAHYREHARGGWGFANERHPWPVSDCTAEALESLLAAERRGWSNAADRLDVARKLAAVEFVLARQNDDGGFGSYEPRRGSMVLRRFNPAEMYGNCMLEYSYTECTASCVRGLAVARAALGAQMPGELHVRVSESIDAGIRFLLDAQQQNGAWPGFWGVNYVYGTFFAVPALLVAGLDREHIAVRRAVRHLLERQRSDGGWGERYEGVLEARERPLEPSEPSRVTQTAWAVLTLQHAAGGSGSGGGREAIERGLAFLLDAQLPDGTWPHDAAVGVFFNTAVLDYRMYKLVFPTWALARSLGEHT